jgi:hypothetical protein
MDQPIHHHGARELSRAFAQPLLRQDPVEIQLAPELMTHMDMTRCSMLLRVNAIRIHSDETGIGRALCRRCPTRPSLLALAS